MPVCECERLAEGTEAGAKRKGFHAVAQQSLVGSSRTRSMEPDEGGNRAAAYGDGDDHDRVHSA
jgi:hypothetical protein